VHRFFVLKNSYRIDLTYVILKNLSGYHYGASFPSDGNRGNRGNTSNIVVIVAILW